MPQNPDITPLASARSTLLRLVVMRTWVIALLGAMLLLIPLVAPVSLPQKLLLPLLGGYLCFNLAMGLRTRRLETLGHWDIAGQLSADLLVMGLVLFCTGGATNPLVFVLILPVAVGAFLLPQGFAAALALLATASYALLMVDYLPLLTNPVQAGKLHLSGMWLTFAVSVAALVLLISRMTALLRARDSHLIRLREQQLRDEQLIALGTLAAGTAHELGTPLATMGVLASELVKDTRLPQDTQEDMALLWQEILRCKEIISSLTARAGAQRLEGAHPKAAGRWLRQLFALWHQSRPHCPATLKAPVPDGPWVIVEPALEQGLGNLLDNAANTGTPVELEVRWDKDFLSLQITDQGPGFPQTVLQMAGKQQLPTGTSGSGIGLLLSFATIERLGGTLTLTNQPDGGGLASIQLPLAKQDTAMPHGPGHTGY